MALPVTIPNQFANATSSIPLSQLDGNFSTLANAVNGINSGSETLANLVATTANVTTGNITTVNATTVDTTNIEVTNIKAKDGTASATIADSTGVMTIGSSVLTTTDINGGTLDNVVIGGATANAATFTSITDSGNLTFTGTGNRITGDFSNATAANRVTFQTSTTNGATVVNAIPNGTGTYGGFTGFNASDTANSSVGSIAAAASEVQVVSTKTGTGTYLPMTFYTNAGERMRIDTSGNVGVGTSSPAKKLHVNGDFRLGDGGGTGAIFTDATVGLRFLTPAAGTSTTEAMRIDSSGNLLVGKTTSSSTTQGNAIGPVLANFIASTASPSDGPQIQIGNIAASVVNGYRYISFRVNAGGTEVGSITTNGTSSTAYGTSSDYRLKENIAPMTGALAKVAALKPCTYTWKSNGSAGEGFIAHELQAVVPDAVIGEKDAVNEDGSIKPQNIDTSFLVATLTAAIQELSAKNDALEARIAALEGAQA